MTVKKETAITTRPQLSPLTLLGQRWNIEPTKLVEVLRGTVIKPDKNGKVASNEEVAAFCVVANQYDLNPWTREIYAFFSPDKGVTAIVPIDGWVKIVNRHKDAHGELDFDGCEFEEVEGANGLPISCTCTIHVKGREHPIVATERYAECKRNTNPWSQHPFRMLRHKSYMQAARYAFGLSGIHDEDEARDITGEAKVGVAMPVELPPAPVAESTPQEAEPTQQPPAYEVISEAQGKRLFAIARKAGWTNEQIRDYLRPRYGISHTKEVSRANYEAICADMAKDPADESLGPKSEGDADDGDDIPFHD